MMEQDQFETWAKSNFGQPDFSGYHVRGGAWFYHHNIVRLCWECWQYAVNRNDGYTDKMPAPRRDSDGMPAGVHVMTQEEIRKALTARATKTLDLRWGRDAGGFRVLQQRILLNDGKGGDAWANVPVMER